MKNLNNCLSTKIRMSKIDEIKNILNSLNLDNCSKTDIQVIKYLTMLSDMRKSKNIPKPSDLHISTKSAKCKLTHILNIENLAMIMEDIVRNKKNDTIVGLEYGPISIGETKKKKNKKKKNINIDKPKFYNQITLILKPCSNGKNVNVKYFLNGSISMTGCKEDSDGILCLNNFINEIKKYPKIFEERKHIDTINAIKYNITMINTNYSLGYKIERFKLFKILTQNFKFYVSFDPSIYQGVKISYMWNSNNLLKDGICKCEKQCRVDKGVRKKNICKIVTVSIFQSGNIIITGACDIKQTNEAYEFINNILCKYYSEIVQFSVLDCGSGSDSSNESCNESDNE